MSKLNISEGLVHNILCYVKNQAGCYEDCNYEFRVRKPTILIVGVSQEHKRHPNCPLVEIKNS